MDERILKILKQVAYGEVNSDDIGYECHYCSGDAIYDHPVDWIAHRPDCAITLAREVLREMKMPLHVYKVTYAYAPLASFGNGHRLKTEYICGYDESETQEEYPKGPEYNRYNVQFEYVQDL